MAGRLPPGGYNRALAIGDTGVTAAELAQTIVVASGLQILILAVLEIWAYRNFKHHCFLILLAGTLLSLGCWWLLSLPWLVHSSVSIKQYQIGTALYVAYTVVGLWGFVSLLVAVTRNWGGRA